MTDVNGVVTASSVHSVESVRTVTLNLFTKNKVVRAFRYTEHIGPEGEPNAKKEVAKILF